MSCPSVKRLGSTTSSGVSTYIRGVLQEFSSYTLGRRGTAPEIVDEAINRVWGWCAVRAVQGRTNDDDGMPRG